MATLSERDSECLSTRGIKAFSGQYGVNITFTSVGVAWLFNYLYSLKKLGSSLSLSMMKDLVGFQPDDWRDLRFKAVPLPVYESGEYIQLVFYLNGTPPRAFHPFPPIMTSISKTFSVPLMDCGAFKVKNSQIVNIEFSDTEVEQLSKGETITVSENGRS